MADDMQKKTLIYNLYDPNIKCITHILIETETQPPYIFGSFSEKPNEDKMNLSPSELLRSIKEAEKEFYFEQGDISAICKAKDIE
jgi:hypothetical protein